MNRTLLLMACVAISFAGVAQDMNPVSLNPPSKVRGSSVMEALQDLSDLLWAAYGINRENGKRTAPTAQNSQDVDLYVCCADGVYLYDAVEYPAFEII